MTPQLQTFGLGDCHRTCIAMILDLPRDEVPHFMADVPPGQPADEPESIAAEQAEREWLAERGLTVVNVPIDGNTPLAAVLESVTTWIGDAAVILGGSTGRGVCHSVVLHQGEIYDPAVGFGCSLLSPQPNGFWFVTIYAKATKPLLREPVPASVVTQEEH